jgi:long-subunit acyl-CoA synthetase (AMP-forming)
MRGYYGMADETAAVLSADGWFVTGDIGCTDRSVGPLLPFPLFPISQ